MDSYEKFGKKEVAYTTSSFEACRYAEGDEPPFVYDYDSSDIFAYRLIGRYDESRFSFPHPGMTGTTDDGLFAVNYSKGYYGSYVDDANQIGYLATDNNIELVTLTEYDLDDDKPSGCGG